MQLPARLDWFRADRSPLRAPKVADAIGLATAGGFGLVVAGILEGDIVPHAAVLLAHALLLLASLIIIEYYAGRRADAVLTEVRRPLLLLAFGALGASLVLAFTGALGDFAGAVLAEPSLVITVALSVPMVILGRRIRVGLAADSSAANEGDLKHDQLALVFHELRRSMTTLVSASELALEVDISDIERYQLLETIHRRSLGLSGILEEFMEATRIQAGVLTITQRATSMTDLVTDVASEFEHGREGHVVKVSGNDDLIANIDDGKLRVVLRNLISNAISYSPRKSTVAVRFSAQKNDVIIQVEDEGPGVPAEHRQQIFEQFYRVPGSTARGFGLGLYITRQLVVAHGGNISVTDGATGGALFTIVLPGLKGKKETVIPLELPAEFEPTSELQPQTKPGRIARPSTAGIAELPGGSAMR